MKKKFFAMLMSLVMIISLVPMTAFAADCEHENVTYVPTTPGYHDMKCTDCGHMYGFTFFKCENADDNYDGICDKCGYQYKKPAHECSFDTLVSISDTQHQFKCGCGKYVGEPINHEDRDGDGKCNCGYVMYKAPVEEHEHNYVPHSNNDGTHTSSCNCGLEVTLNCADNDGDGKCDACGYVMYKAPAEEHEHNYVPHSNNDGTHTSSCNCGLEVTLNCADNDGDNKCDACGYVMYKAPAEEHEHNYVPHSNNDGTHTSSCNCGLEVTLNCADNNGDNKCDSCGYVMYKAPAEEHEHNYVAHSNNDGTHNLSCNCGLSVEKVTCLDNDGDGKCDSCGYVKYIAPDEEHEHNYVAHSNNDGTHNLSCNCGLSVEKVTCLDNDGDGKCDSCGYVKYVAPDEEHEHNYVAHSNNDGTHNLSCNCGLSVEKVTCLDNDGDGKCDSCGYVKYVAPEDPEEPEKPADPEKPAAGKPGNNLDAVPDTGNSVIVYVLGAMMAIGVAGAAVLIATKKRI